jgi:hypothetical protein
VKKSIIILWFIVLTVFFYSFYTKNSDTLYLLINTENIVNSFVQIEDNCQEDNITRSNTTSLKINLLKDLDWNFSPYLLPGTGPSVWQPPE